MSNWYAHESDGELMQTNRHVRILVLLLAGMTGLAFGVALVRYWRRFGQPALAARPAVLTPSSRATSAAVRGGFLVQLWHSGAPLAQDDASVLGRPIALDVKGVVQRELELRPDTPGLAVPSIQHVVLDDNGVVTPRRALDVVARDKVVWRLELSVFSGSQDITPRLTALVGKPVRIQVNSVIFGVTPFVAVRVSDAVGLVLALDYQLPEPLDDPDVAVMPGSAISVADDECGTYTTHLLTFAGDSQLSLRPGQSGALRIHERSYEISNLASSFVSQSRCTDQVHDIAWSARRL